MADQVDLPVKKEEEEVPDVLKEYRELHDTSINKLLTDEPKPEVKEEPKEEIKEEPKPEEKVEAKVEEPKIDPEAIAKQAAEEALATVRKEAEARLAEAKAKEDADKAKLEGRPKWEWDNDPKRPKDEQGNPLPYNYAEVAEEGRRLGKMDALSEVEQREAARAKELADAKAADEAKNVEIKTRQDEFNKQLQSEMDADLNDLYSTNKLPKIADPNNPNDEGLLARNALFKKGIEVNQERASKGLPPIRSIKLVYYEHYTSPAKQPAGANAPVMGNAAPAANTNQEDEYNWVRDHGKSPRQILSELRQRAKSASN